MSSIESQINSQWEISNSGYKDQWEEISKSHLMMIVCWDWCVIQECWYIDNQIVHMCIEGGVREENTSSQWEIGIVCLLRLIMILY